MNQYLDMFLEESKEHLQACNHQLLLLENNPEDLSIVNEIFRSAHTLKGMSATMGYEDLANLTHQMENVLDAIRNGKIKVTPEVLDVVFASVDHLEAMVLSISEGGDGKRDVSGVVAQLKQIENGEPIGDASALKEVAAAVETNSSSNKGASYKSTYDDFELTVIEQSAEQGFQTYEVTVTLRPDCLLKAARVYMIFEVLEKIGEVIKSNPPVEQLEAEQFDHEFTITLVTKDSVEDVRNKILKVSEVDKVEAVELLTERLKQGVNIEKENSTENTNAEDHITKKESSVNQTINHKAAQQKTIRVNIDRLDALMNLFEELVIDRGRLEQISKELKNSELTETVERMSRVSGDLQNIILNMRMVPVETVFNRFPRMVRQVARDLNKKINLEIIGAETELDRTVIDEIGDPLVHLLRNAIDHGIEMPVVRAEKGKNEEGTVKLTAFHSGNHVFIEISDDGAGINREKVLNKAISKGIVSEEQAKSLSDKEVYSLIFSSGFSTADKISDISGRGVGLDVVKSKIESLGGTVTIDSVEGQGSTFSIQLPLTLSIISVLLVELEKEKYAIPLSSIIETAIIKKDQILNAHNQPTIDFRGKVVPLVNLKEVFQMSSSILDDSYISIVVVRKGDRLAALVVDSFIGQQEVVLKSLGDYLQSVFAISGATILGDGKVALIVDCNALIK